MILTCIGRTGTGFEKSNHNAQLNIAGNLSHSWVITSKYVPSPEIKHLSLVFGETFKADREADVTYQQQFLQMSNKALREC